MKNSTKQNQRKCASRRFQLMSPGLVLGLVTVITTGLIPSTASAGQRPIGDFLSRQGAFCLQLDASGNIDCGASSYGGSGCFLFVPPSPNLIAWTDPKGNTAMQMDYAGLQNAVLGGILGTTVSGSINERPLADGRAEVEVQLQTRNALTWAIQGFDFANGPLLFGARLSDVLNGANPSLGDCTLYVKFINAAPGAPLPDLVELLQCRVQDFEVLSFYGQASGTLANGAPGRAQVTQTGLIGTAFLTGFKGRLYDAFPAEKIVIRATGK